VTVSVEIAALLYDRIEVGKLLIQVIVGDRSQIPPLIKPLARVRIEEIDRLVDAFYHRRARTSARHPHRRDRAACRGARRRPRRMWHDLRHGYAGRLGAGLARPTRTFRAS
jgi:hypothetical protein